MAVALVLALSLLIACTLHARGARRQAAREEPALRQVFAELPPSDVALTGGARWLRAVSLEEPGAAQSDGIAFPDPEPGGGAITPPRAAWAAEVTPASERRP